MPANARGAPPVAPRESARSNLRAAFTAASRRWGDTVGRLAWEGRAPPEDPTMTDSTANYVIPFRELTLDDLPRVGGKNASLGEMLQALAAKRVAVPEGFALTAEAFRATVREAGGADDIYRALDRLDPGNIREL